MFPLCFVHGVHSLGFDQAPERAARVTLGRRRTRSSLAVACLAVAVVATITLAGCDGPDRATAAHRPAPTAFDTRGVPEPDFDALLLDEFP